MLFFHKVTLICGPLETEAKAERRGRQNACAWQTWQGYYLRVISWSSLNINVFWSLQKNICLSEVWRKVISNKMVVTLAVFFLLPSCCVSSLLLEVTCCVRLHTLLHVVACCFQLSRKVWNQSNFLPHANKCNIVNCCIHLNVALSVSCGVSKAFSRLCSGELCTLMDNKSYHKSDSFAPKQKDIIIFLKNLFGTKRTVSVDSDTILYYKLFRFFPSLFAIARHI